MAIEENFTILDTVDSTNNYAMGCINASLAKHGMAWFARNQTKGKGQRGKSWNSQRDMNLTMSIIVEPALLELTNQFHLSAAVAVSCFEFFNSYAGDATKIKWPNDLYWRDRKAGGILIENLLKGKTWKWAVVGIGININQIKFAAEIQNPVSLKQITGKNFDTITLAKELYELLMQNLEKLGKADSVIEKYNEHLYKLNHLVNFKKDGVEFDTVVKEVLPSGRLITVDEFERVFDFGEVEWIIKN